METDAQRLLDDSHIRSFTEQALALLEKSRQIKPSIVIGIIGGTGVGKSTLINALAHEEISQASDRRPYTDRAVIYRHQDQDSLSSGREDLFKSPDAIHVIDSIKDIVIVDMPDIDSHNRGNERTVLELAPLLDMVIWVVTPEKYADASLFEFLKNCGAHQSNFIFVFNKSDQLLDETSADKYLKLKEALGDFIFQLKSQTGIINPRIFSVSATIEFSGSTSDQFLLGEFSRLRELIMVNRRAKEVETIKSLNLHSQSSSLVEQIHSHTEPDLKRQAIQHISDIREDFKCSESMDKGNWENDEISSLILRRLTVTDNSLSSIKLAMRLLTWSFRKEAESDKHFKPRLMEALTSLGAPCVEKMSRIQSRIDSEALLGLSDSISKSNSRDLGSMIHKLADQSVATALKLSDTGKNRIRSFLLRMSQMIGLSLPVVLLLFRLSDHGRLNGMFQDSSVKGVFYEIVILISNIFSPEGLSALISLLMLESLLILWLAKRRSKKLRKKSIILTQLVLENFSKSMDDSFVMLAQSFNTNLSLVSSSLDKLEDLNELFSVRTKKNFSDGHI